MLLLPASVTLREARETLSMLTQTLQRDGAAAATVDASGLQQFDSSALAVLLECARVAQGQGKTFAVHGAPAQLGELARLYGVDALLTLQ
jgi:phospholipid transport system transporter-binding protein